MSENEDQFYETIYAFVSTDIFLDNIMLSTKKILKEASNREPTIFDASKMADSVLFTLFGNNIELFMRAFNFPVVDFSALRNGIKTIIQKRLLAEATLSKKEASNAN